MNTTEQNKRKMTQNDMPGPSGVPFGGVGSGYYEINPDGKVSRTCNNNIHHCFIDMPGGMFLAYREQTAEGHTVALRLQRDDSKISGMTAYRHSDYLGLFPIAEFSFSDPIGEATKIVPKIRVYSGAVPHDSKRSSLPAAFYEITLHNTGKECIDASVALSWADIIGRGLRDTKRYADSNFCTFGDSADWYYMTPPKTRAARYSVSGWQGVRQYAESSEALWPEKWTLQNYNHTFSVLADGGEVSVLPAYRISDENEWHLFREHGGFFGGKDTDVPLSDGSGEPNMPQSASAVSVRVQVPAGTERIIRFLVSWYMQEPDEARIEKMPDKSHGVGCDYARYYHNFFSDIDCLNRFLIAEREEIYRKTFEWQKPLINSSLPSWLIFKIINSGYVLFTNCVLTKRGNFASLEGGMGGLGGTMDQRMCSHPFYQKLFPDMDNAELEQFSMNPHVNGEIAHFDIQYYEGVNDRFLNYAPITVGSMTDNTGAWMLQLLKTYEQTGNRAPLARHYDRMKTAMSFLKEQCRFGVPVYYTTFDDATHPKIFIFNATIYLLMLHMAERFSEICNDSEQAEKYAAERSDTEHTLQMLYVEENGGYYAFGADEERKNVERDIVFSGMSGGQFLSRYCGWGDILPFEQMTSSLKKLLETAVQNANDYYAPKIYNWVTEQSLDREDTSCWPFYHDCYVGMAALQHGFVEDALKIWEHTQRVHQVRGWMWSQSLWVPDNLTYMTAPVSWFIPDVLAGAALNVNKERLTLGPCRLPGGKPLQIPLYFPDFWAELQCDYETKKSSLTVTKVFGESCHIIREIVIQPNGKSSEKAVTHRLSIPFQISEGAILRLDEYLVEMQPAPEKPSILRPTQPFAGFSNKRNYEGTGLTACFYKDMDFKERLMTNIMPVLRWPDSSNPHVESAWKALRLDGIVTTKFSQQYTFYVTYSGGIRLWINGELILSDWDNRTIKTVSFVKDYIANQFSKLRIEFADEKTDKKLEIEWWSTTQTREVLAAPMLYLVADAYSKISSGNYISACETLKVEDKGKTLAYITDKTWAQYGPIDFGKVFGELTFEISCATPTNGGWLSVYMDKPDGFLLGQVRIHKNGADFWNYEPFCFRIKNASVLTGVHDLYFLFETETEGFICNCREFRFRKQEQ